MDYCMKFWDRILRKLVVENAENLQLFLPSDEFNHSIRHVLLCEKLRVVLQSELLYHRVPWVVNHPNKLRSILFRDFEATKRKYRKTTGTLHDSNDSSQERLLGLLSSPSEVTDWKNS